MSNELLAEVIVANTGVSEEEKEVHTTQMFFM